MSSGADRSGELEHAARRAFAEGGRLRITGSGSKSFLTRGRDAEGGASQLLSTAEHQGILEYSPDELVITARAGTPLRELERVLAASGQQLPFEPPRFQRGGTLGGALAAGLSGPGRPARGSVRDAVLGIEMLNGRGERLRFGGQVMKNVAGYDLSRLQVGAFGTLGLLLAASVRVLPLPSAECTREFELDAAVALQRCRLWSRQPLPISATCWLDGRLRVRLSGAEPAVQRAARDLGGEDAPVDFWQRLRDHELPFLRTPGLWRCSLPPAAPQPLEECLITWGGAERWWYPQDPDPEVVRARIAASGGTVRPFDGRFGERYGAHLSDAENHYAVRLKHAFDPAGVFNPELGPHSDSTCPPRHED